MMESLLRALRREDCCEDVNFFEEARHRVGNANGHRMTETRKR
jgi:hypothetical protein